MPEPKYPKIEVELVGQDGNAVFILGKVLHALSNGLNNDYSMSPSEVTAECIKFTHEATSSDYDHLLQTCIKWVEVL